MLQLANKTIEDNDGIAFPKIDSESWSIYNKLCLLLQISVLHYFFGLIRLTAIQNFLIQFVLNFEEVIWVKVSTCFCSGFCAAG